MGKLTQHKSKRKAIRRGKQGLNRVLELFKFLKSYKEHKCRGGITTDAIGWLKLWARIDVGESGEGVSVQETLMKK